MSNLNELNLSDEAVDVDVDNMPEQFGGGGFIDPQPGDYVFSMPKDVTFKPMLIGNAERINAEFIGGNGFKMESGERFTTRLSNMSRGRKDGPKGAALAYLLQAVGFSGRLVTNLDYGHGVEWAIEKQKSFKAYVEWRFYCNPNKPRRIAAEVDGRTKLIEDPAGTKGCGRSFGETAYVKGNGDKVNAIPTNGSGELTQSFKCVCGGAIRIFPELINFRSVG